MTKLSKLLVFCSLLLISSCQSPNTSTDQGSNSEGLLKSTDGYSTWLKLNKNPIPATSGDPHAPSQGEKNVFINQEREELKSSHEKGFIYPEGTIIVKEGINKDEDFVELIAVMKKVKGSNPEHNDWVFEEYLRKSNNDKFKLAFKDNICWQCHSGVKEKDYVFTPLE